MHISIVRIKQMSMSVPLVATLRLQLVLALCSDLTYSCMQTTHKTGLVQLDVSTFGYSHEPRVGPKSWYQDILYLTGETC